MAVLWGAQLIAPYVDKVTVNEMFIETFLSPDVKIHMSCRCNSKFC